MENNYRSPYNYLTVRVDRLFEDETITKFENGRHDEVMFVVEAGKLKALSI